MTCPPGFPQRVFALLERGERVCTGVQGGGEGGAQGSGSHSLEGLVGERVGIIACECCCRTWRLANAYTIKLVAATVATEDVRCLRTTGHPPSCDTSRNTRVG